MQHYKSGDAVTLKKLKKILEKLSLNPKTGTGKPEQLKHELTGYWSRRVN
ncbi:type II toxin-antitoxin system YoeB family toxin [Pedobacter insulae]|uniref:YoeB-like toxin of type II toxin-antitoxin system n=1 Tax=Pedobacter insulae TaxID=414048 RepID=A0A1I2YXJ9_9SPHI|nr:type II toxin-antitoxin system YoeB family toxin [Pedobacter insulae]SFH30190.1 YoeB-like toxin of type II toxin-antitoxin system [Pedobacter insulae]